MNKNGKRQKQTITSESCKADIHQSRKQTKTKNGKRPDNHIREQEGRHPFMKEADKASKADNQKLRK
jgi:hypothetical protein